MWVEDVLSEAEYALWARQYGPDRRHTVQVANEVEHRLGGDATRPVLAAALLHDIGKIDADLGTWGRGRHRCPTVAGRDTAKRWMLARVRRPDRAISAPSRDRGRSARRSGKRSADGRLGEGASHARRGMDDRSGVGRVLFEVDDD